MKKQAFNDYLATTHPRLIKNEVVVPAIKQIISDFRDSNDPDRKTLVNLLEKIKNK